MGADKNSHDPFLFRPFENLKQIIESKVVDVAGKHGSDAVRIDPPSDAELFAQAMKEVREIDEYRELPVRRKKTAARKAPPSDREALRDLQDIIAGRRPISLQNTQEYVEWVDPSLKTVSRNTVVADLQEGRFSVQGDLDLHGFVLEEAEMEVSRFLDESRRNGYRCVKIIHGRGLRSPNGPVLKNALVKWLSGRLRKNVAAFVTARQCDGGLGALYVLLK